ASDAAADQDLPVLRLGTKPGGEVAHRADRSVAGALGKTDLAQCSVTLRDTSAEAKFAAIAAPGRDQLARRSAHRHCHLDRALGWVGTWHRVVEEHHDAVAREMVEGAFELGDERPQRAVVLAQKFELVLGLGCFSKGGVAAQIAKHDDNFAAMAFEDLLVTL